MAFPVHREIRHTGNFLHTGNLETGICNDHFPVPVPVPVFLANPGPVPVPVFTAFPVVHYTLYMYILGCPVFGSKFSIEGSLKFSGPST